MVTLGGAGAEAKIATSLTANRLIGHNDTAALMLADGLVIRLKANQSPALNPKLTCTEDAAVVAQLVMPVKFEQAGGSGCAMEAGGALVVAVSVA